MDEVNGFSLTMIGGMIGAFVKAFMSDSKAAKADAKTREIEEARIATKMERDKEFQDIKTQVAVLKAQNEMMQKQLAEGTTRFSTMETDLKKINSNLNIIIGQISEMRRSGHTPEREPV